jgi:hypothetical protein
MPLQNLLILAVTQMLGGVCVAGMSTEAEPTTGLRWIRPVREFEHVLLGDVTTSGGTVIRPFDVVEFRLVRARPSPPHTEDWLADFQHRPRILRRLESERRVSFLRKYIDPDPSSVLESQTRSLCLMRPDWVKAGFELDGYTGKFEARLAFALGEHRYLGTGAKAGLSVTDLRWRALGRSWLPLEGGTLELDARDLGERLSVREVFLAIGLTRAFQGAHWPIVVGVHTVPDYEVSVDYRNP